MHVSILNILASEKAVKTPRFFEAFISKKKKDKYINKIEFLLYLFISLFGVS